MSRVILHRAIASPPARAVLMLCQTIGVPVEIKEVNLLRGEHRTPEYLKLNPMGTVPVIQDGDFVLSESHAIMKYLLSVYGGERHEALYPRDVRARALVDQCMYFDAGVMFKALIATARGALFGGHTGPTKENLQEIQSSFGVVEAYLKGRQYVAADHFTLADFSVGSSATGAETMYHVPPDKFPRAADWLARIKDEPVFKEVNAPGVAYLKKLVHSCWEKNKIQK